MPGDHSKPTRGGRLDERNGVHVLRPASRMTRLEQRRAGELADMVDRS